MKSGNQASSEPELAKRPKTEKAVTEEPHYSWKPRPILPDHLSQQELPLEKSYVGQLKDKRDISRALASLSSQLPCPAHLKRVRGTQLYLTPVSSAPSGPAELRQLLQRLGFELELLEDEFEILEVPASPARTKAQMSWASKLWPLNFHPDHRLEALLSGAALADPELKLLERCARLLARTAQSAAVGSELCNGAALLLEPAGTPAGGRILALAASSLEEHPMWHAAMLAVDLVAELQGGGAWQLRQSKQPTLEPGEKRPRDAELPLKYPAWLDDPEPGFVFSDTGFTGEDEDPPRPTTAYLCTGYWAVLLQEPCPLCAMALLHSRVSRIFYGAPNPRTGILGSKAILHSVDGLNHRYQVWSSVLEDECAQALEKCRFV